MAKIESYTPGSFCWAELATTDAAGAKKFYPDLLGWTFTEMSIPGGVYIIFQAGGNDAAAMYQTEPGPPAHWNAYFSVANVDESAAKVQALGGKIVAGPLDVMESGRMATVEDPQGAMFSLWQAKQHIGATHPGPLSQFAWPELNTPDPVSAVAFYSGLFGWKTKPDSGLDSAQYIEWVNAGKHIGGLLPMRGPEWKGVPPHWMLYVTVADCDERSAKVKELGGAVCVTPSDIPNVGRFSVVNDPQGAVFSLFQMRSGAAIR